MEMNGGMDFSLNLYVDIDVRSDGDIGTGGVNTNQRDRRRYSCGCFPGGSVVKNLPANAEDMRETGIPGSRRSPGEGHGNPLQYSCLENAMDRRAFGARVHGVTNSWTLQITHAHTHTHTHI